MESGMPEEALVYGYRLLRTAINRFEKAKASRDPKISVTEISSRLARGKGKGYEEGLRVHSSIFGDVDWILEYRDVCIPFPLAWLFRFGWVHGVTDTICFRSLVPYKIVEVKSYDKVKLSETTQASVYGLLVFLNFGVKPVVYVETPHRLVLVSDWEEKALDALLYAPKIIRREKNT
jgi:hypothetical protein